MGKILGKTGLHERALSCFGEIPGAGADDIRAVWEKVDPISRAGRYEEALACG